MGAWRFHFLRMQSYPRLYVTLSRQAPTFMRSLRSAFPSRKDSCKLLAAMEGCDGHLDHGRGHVPRGGAKENAVDGPGRGLRLSQSLRYWTSFPSKRFCKAWYEPYHAAGDLLHHAYHGPVCRRST